ncbi:MAG: hypothetical protein BWY23_02589 [Spirochaetes bacterium ADurb.Bin218]|jgi:hypothetical protein|nr:hypothetical protein [Elusimicrobiales bacterium]OQA94958.1 MAG: hypothetical protein BWY23_02589 [Spirochaetes bacterium ADurb.Bin218]
MKFNESKGFNVNVFDGDEIRITVVSLIEIGNIKNDKVYVFYPLQKDKYLLFYP